MILHDVLLLRLNFVGIVFQCYQLHLPASLRHTEHSEGKRVLSANQKNKILPTVLDLTLNRVKIKCIKTGQILHVKYGNNQAVQLICKPEVCKCYMVEWRSQHSPLKNKLKTHQQNSFVKKRVQCMLHVFHD